MTSANCKVSYRPIEMTTIVIRPRKMDSIYITRVIE